MIWVILGIFVTGNFTMHAGTPVVPVVDNLGAENKLVGMIRRGVETVLV